MIDLAIVLTTAPAADAERIGRTLVEERLAACANILPPMTSIYHWQGAIAQDEECQLVLKTERDQVAAVRERLLQIHPYDTPEFLVVEVGDASDAYAAWVRDSVRR